MKKNKTKIKEKPPVKQLVYKLHAFYIPLFLLILIITLHLKIFSNFENILNLATTEEFKSSIFYRNIKLVFILLFCFILLYYTIRYFRSRLIRYLFTTFLWLLIFTYGAELYLSAYPPSQGNGEAYISRIWFRKYWKTNIYGFRDKEYFISDLIPKNNLLLFIGDSFVAGHGIKDPEDRTYNLLEKSFKNEYYFINAGINGIGTQEEYNLLKTFPAQPKVVILSHVSNDIEELLPSDESFSSRYESSQSLLVDYVYDHSRNSVLLDLCYHFFKLAEFNSTINNKDELKTSKVNAIYDWYKIDSIFKKHLNLIQQIADYTCDSLNAKFILITYPENYDIDSFDTYINKKIIENISPNKNTFFLNLGSTYKNTKESKRSVNFFDGHPSKRINQIVSDSLILIMQSERFKENK